MGSFADRHGKHDAGVTRREALALAAFGLAATPGPAFAAGLEGQLTWGIHVSLAPTWFDPAETPGIITPFMVLYALHDGMVKPMPGQPLAPSLAESWSGSEDGLAYDFLVRKDAKFHRGMALWPRSEKEQSRKQGGELSPSIPPTVRFSPLAL